MKIEHTVDCPAPRDRVWKFWTNVDNWAIVDPAVDWVELEGAFVTGAKGRTKPRGMEASPWQITKVDEGERAVIEIEAPGVVVSFSWQFTDLPDGGTRLFQTVTLSGEQAEAYTEVMEGMKQSIPAGMDKLVASIIKAEGEKEAR